MQITVNDKNDIKVIAFSGNLETNTAPDAEKEINALIENGVNKILINFENLGYISSVGLRVLLRIGKQLKSKEGNLRICSLNVTVNEIFEMSGFSMVFNIFETESDAMKSF
ncbi:MAG: STAS domain-containing protein [Thiotrichaceae bacterium]|nr:STAS domain-containing protein [Thiotrichaceae bacterium]